MNKIYLCGSDAKTLDEEATRLRVMGYRVANPREIINPEDTWHAQMRNRISAMMGCDQVAITSGSDLSGDFWIEIDLARKLEISVVFAKDVQA